MYRLKQIIENEKETSLIPEVGFHPDGSIFAVSAEQTNEVRIYDAQTMELRRSYTNPEALLDEPHAVAIAGTHVVAASRHKLSRPSRINVYRLDSPSDRPVTTFDTPFAQLREAHSMAISRNRLVVAYCESDGRTSGVVSYPFDDRSGTIGEPVTLVEECFAQYGDPKGVTFSADGTEVLVSFTSEKKKSWLEQRCLNFLYMWEKARFRSPVENWHMLRGKPYGERARLKKPPPILENGVLIFEIDEDGVISKTPVRSLIRETFCRLENVHCVDGACAISDTVNHRVYLYDIDSDPDLERPSQVLSENLWLPHAVKFSPNKQFIVVTNFSLKVWRQNILWKVWKKRRTDTIAIFELENDGAKTVTV